jgi:superfamily II DNA or RNA helicase
MAIIASGTLNPRQRIQRIGRIVRPSGNRAIVISLLARGTTEETEVGRKDDALLGTSRVVQLDWPLDLQNLAGTLGE